MADESPRSFEEQELMQETTSDSFEGQELMQETTSDSFEEQELMQETTSDSFEGQELMQETTSNSFNDSELSNGPIVHSFEEPGGFQDLETTPSFNQNSKNESNQKWGPLQEPEKSYSTAAMIFVMALFILVIGLCIFIAVNLSESIQFQMPNKDQEYTTTDGSDPWKEIFGDKNAGIEEGSFSKQSEANKSDYDDAGRGTDSYQEQSEYYEIFEDSIDTSVPYKIIKNSYQHSESERPIEIVTSYVQIEGEIPNLEQINKNLRDSALALNDLFEKNMDYKPNNLDEEICIQVDSFVTYNDAETISICIKDDYSFPGIRGITYNLVTGMQIKNTEVLTLNQSFASEFRERSLRQNGKIDTLDFLSDQQLMQYLTSEDTLILFYTPIGLELGFCYQINDYHGWITISMKDYKNYMGGI